jgi:hypothetical protein
MPLDTIKGKASKSRLSLYPLAYEQDMVLFFFTGLTRCPDVVMHGGTLSSFCCSFFRSASEKKNNDEMGSTMLPQAKTRLKRATA